MRLAPNFSIYDYDDSLKLISEMLSGDKEEAQLFYIKFQRGKIIIYYLKN